MCYICLCVCVIYMFVCVCDIYVCVYADGEVLVIREHLIDELDYILLPAGTSC